MIIVRQAIWKSRKCACEADLEPTALFIGGYNKIWILDLELCNTVRYHMMQEHVGWTYLKEKFNVCLNE